MAANIHAVCIRQQIEINFLRRELYKCQRALETYMDPIVSDQQFIPGVDLLDFMYELRNDELPQEDLSGRNPSTGEETDGGSQSS
jgi:hypothetical protein